ncbi:hypothetical protein, conserved [Eimeria praecox]|uniref:F5/8 type C domain-containing protein n=1 Tax=Eimeria praecox TaxID=51316 RepID=U6GX04_9EIME|nr:hypothetical protein, conserved [Eimeria praecox]
MGVLQRPFEEGTVSFAGLTIGVAGEGYRLRFTLLSPAVGRSIAALSEPFSVHAAAPAALHFLLQPPPDIAAGNTFQVSVQLVDAHGNPVLHPHTISLSASRETEETDSETEESSSELVQFLGTATPTAETQKDKGIAVFNDLALPPSKHPLYLKAACTSCEGTVRGQSLSSVVRSSSFVTLTACNLLLEGSKDGSDTCTVSISLEALLSRGPGAPVTIQVDSIEPVSLQGDSASDSVSITVAPTSLVFNPEETAVPRTLQIKALDDPHVRYSTDISDVASGLLLQHYRVHLHAESEDPLWGPEGVEWLDDAFIDIKVLDDDKVALQFSQLPEQPLVLRRGDEISYEVALRFSPSDGPVQVTLEAPVGVVVDPRSLTFDKDNWNVSRPVHVEVTPLFPAAPLIAAEALASGHTASKFALTHHLQGKLGAQEIQEKEEIFFWVAEEGKGKVVWKEVPGAVQAGASLALSFSLSLQPMEIVSIALNCGPLLETVGSSSLILTPLQWQRGATFRLLAKDDGVACLAALHSALRAAADTQQPSRLESCAVFMNSGDARFVSSSEGDEGSSVNILVYKQHCADNTYRARCPCLSGCQGLRPVCNASRGTSALRGPRDPSLVLKELQPARERQLVVYAQKCPAGSFCPTAKFADMQGMSSCLPCPKNHACPTPLEKVPCERPTQFAPKGQQICRPCPREFHCEEEDPKACKPGYTSLEGEGVCSKAKPPAVTVLDLQIRENIGSRTDAECPEGRYNQGTGCFPYGPLGYCGTGRCYTCEKGSICPPGAAAPLPLDEGYFSVKGDIMSVHQAMECPRGTYCPEGSSTLEYCESDEICQGRGAPKFKCPPGTKYRIRSFDMGRTGAEVSHRPHQSISAGDFYRTLRALSCAHLNPSVSLLCLYCPLQSCNSQTNGFRRCRAGYYCPTGTEAGLERPCVAGTYSNSISLADSSECISCLPGYYCPEGSSEQIPCPRGSYCPKRTESPDHHPCPGGTYNPTTMAIDVVQCLPCPAGKYCPQGSAAPIDCPAGTYSDGYGTKYPGPGSHPSMCRWCPSGYSCTDGLRSPCGMGFTSKEGDGKCMPCPKAADLSRSKKCPTGHYCPPGVSEGIPCPGGTYNPLEGRTGVSDCMISKAGTYAVEGTEVIFVLRGHLSLIKSPAQLKLTTQRRGEDLQTIAYRVPLESTAALGRFNPKTAQRAAIALLGLPTLDSAQKEQSGLRLERSPNKTAILAQLGFTVKPRGWQNPQGNALLAHCVSKEPPIRLPEMDSQVLSALHSDTAKKEQLNFNRVQPASSIHTKVAHRILTADHVFPGLTAMLSMDTRCLDLAREGTVRMKDSLSQTPSAHRGISAKKGTYQDMEGSTFCNLCAGGYYCPIGAEVSFDQKYICPEGSFCPRGSKHSKEYLCPPGFYNPQKGISSVLNCLPCPPGKYCRDAGLAQPSGACAAGFYCSSGARYPNEVLTECIFESGVLGKGTGTCTSSNDPFPTKEEAESLCKTTKECVGIEEKESSFYISSVLRRGFAQSDTFALKKRVLHKYVPLEATARPWGSQRFQETVKQDFSAMKARKNLRRPQMRALLGIIVQKAQQQKSSAPPGHICLHRARGKSNSAKSVRLANSAHYLALQPLQDIAALVSSAKKEAQPLWMSTISAPKETTVPKELESRFLAVEAHTSHRKVQHRASCAQKGTFGKIKGATSVESCQLCEGGQMCNTPGTGTEGNNAMANCPAGFYCPEGAGAVTPTVCTYGEYCPEKSTVPTPCPTGYYCASEALEWPTGRCRGGYVCKLRAATHSPEVATSGAACTENSQGYPCPAGHYCQSGSLVDTFAGSGTSGASGSGGPAKEATFNSLKGIAMNLARGELVIADAGGGRISTIHLTTGILTDVKTGMGNPGGLAVSNDGNTLYVSLADDGKVVAINLNENTQADVISGLSTPSGLCLSLDGETLYVAEAGANQISAIDLDTKTKTAAVGDGATANIVLNQPRAVALSLDGEIYIADTGVPRIIRAHGTKVEEVAIVPPVLRTMKDSALHYELGEITSMAYGKLAHLANFDGFLRIWRLDLQTNHLEQILGTGTQGFSGDGRIIPAPEANINTPTGVVVADQGQGQPEVTGRCSDGYYCPEGSAKTNAVACPPGHFCKAYESVYSNVALHGTVELTTSGDFVGSGTPDKVTNGDTGLGTGWVSKNTSSGGHGVTVDFGDLFFINEVTVISGTAGGKNTLSSFAVHYFHSASSTYIELFSVSSNKESTYSLTFGEVATRKLMLSTTDSQVYLSEIQVSGTSSPGPAAPTPCPKGWYQDLKAQTACKICPEGYFCADSTAAPTTKCHAGYYCPKGSYNGYENPCPLGTYNQTGGAKSVSECLPCPVGKYCGSRGLTTATGECLAGYYCKGGAWSPAPHPEEKNPDGVTGPAGSLCPIGYYCPAGTESPQACQEGARTDLLPLQVFGEDSDDYGLCPVGHYCPSGSGTPTPCTRGTFQADGVLLGGTALKAALGLAHALPGSIPRSPGKRNANPALRGLNVIC